MEIIGKVLSLTLLTIFGSAAATVYLVDSDFFPSLREKTPIIYSSVSGSSDEDRITNRTYNPADIDNRKRQSKEYYEVTSIESKSSSQNTDSIWGQSYTQNQIQRAQYLASTNSIDSLRNELEHWNAQYQNAQEQGQKRIAKLAYSNYKDYERAIEIKSNPLKQ